MATTTEDLQRTLDDLRGRLAQIDLPAARARMTKAKVDRDLLESQAHGHPGANVLGDVPYLREARVARDKAAEAHKSAVAALRRLESEDEALRREIDHLDRLLSSEGAVEAAHKQYLDSVALLPAAEQKVAKAKETIQLLGNSINEEERAIVEARSKAAAQLLTEAKEGSKGGKVPIVSRERVEALELAKEGAQRELSLAEAELDTLKVERNRAHHRLLVAQTAVTELAYHVAHATYIQALAEHMAAYWRAHRQQFGVADPRSEAIAAVQRLIAAEGG